MSRKKQRCSRRARESAHVYGSRAWIAQVCLSATLSASRQDRTLICCLRLCYSRCRRLSLGSLPVPKHRGWSLGLAFFAPAAFCGTWQSARGQVAGSAGDQGFSQAWRRYVDGGRVECIDALVQLYAHRFVHRQRSRDADQHLGKVGEDAPVMRIVGVGQSGTCHTTVEAEGVEFAAQGAQAGFDVAQAVPIGQLRECHHQVLIQTGKTTLSFIFVVARHATAKRAVGKEADQLTEEGSAMVHPSLLPVGSGSGLHPLAFQGAATSNRKQLSILKELVADATLVSWAVVEGNIQPENRSRSSLYVLESIM